MLCTIHLSNSGKPWSAHNDLYIANQPITLIYPSQPITLVYPSIESTDVSHVRVARGPNT